MASTHYLEGSFASPSNTMIRNLDSSRQSDIPPVFEIFSTNDNNTHNGVVTERETQLSTTPTPDLNQQISSSSTAIINLAFVDDENQSDQQISKL